MSSNVHHHKGRINAVIAAGVVLASLALWLLIITAADSLISSL